MKDANSWFLALATWLFMLCMSTKEFTAAHLVEEQTIMVNTAKWAHVISDRFLSITIDPETIMLGKDAIFDTKRTINLARGLAPSYLRVAGPSINEYRFESLSSGDEMFDNKTITESQWVKLNGFAQEAGLDIIISLNVLQRLNGIWDPRNALDLISYSDKMGYNIDWELGYELQKLDGKISAEQLAIDVTRLRNILNSFSHYKKSIIVGPDITQLYTKQDIEFLRNFIQEAGSSVDAITWHPKYLSMNSNYEPGEGLDYMLERLIFEKEGLVKMLGKHIARKPIWLAESDEHVSGGYFLDALNWAQELGTYAGIGIQTIMKQPNLQEILDATPSYWVSLVHKALIGQVVLDVRHSTANKTNIPVFCHCTNIINNSTATELITTDRYEPGAITIFAINRRSAEIKLSLKLSTSIKQEDIEFHQYLFTADETEAEPLQSRKVLLNGKLLAQGDTGDLPELSPNIEHSGWNFAVSLPPASVAFWVIPKANVKVCVTASKKAIPHKTDIQSQYLVKPGNTAMSINSYINNHSTRNSEMFSRDLKHSTVKISVNETSRVHQIDDKKTNTYKKKKYLSLKNKKSLGRKNNESEDFANNDADVIIQSQGSQHKKDLYGKDGYKLNESIVKESELVPQENYKGSISNEQKSSGARFKRYVPENNPISFSAVSLDMFQQPSLVGRTAKTRRKKKAEMKSDKKDEQRKDNKIKQKDDHIHATLFDPFLSSLENEEQYFRHMNSEDNEIRTFPTGNIYLKQGDSSEERRNIDYDYVDKDEKGSKQENNDDDDLDLLDSTDLDISLKPGEFFETVHVTTDKIDEKFIGYGGELWEAETITLARPADKLEDDAFDDDAYDQEVVHESGPTEEEDRKRKAATARLLNSYLTEGYADKQSEEDKHKEKPVKKSRIQRKTERKQEHVDDFDDDLFIDHKEKTKKHHEKPFHHHHQHHHHHITGHSKSMKDGKQNHFDYLQNIHNHKEKTKKTAHHVEKDTSSDKDDIFFPHIISDKETDHKVNYAYHRNFHSSEEKTEPMKNSHKGREKIAKTQIKTDVHSQNNDSFEGSSPLSKASRQSRARKISHKLKEESNANIKSKDDSKIVKLENNNLSRTYQESSENRRIHQQNDKKQKKKNNKPNIPTSTTEETYREKDANEDYKKSKNKQKYSDYEQDNKYQTEDKSSEATDSKSIENATKISKKRVHFMDTNNSFEDGESKLLSEETTKEESELDLDSVEDNSEKTISPSIASRMKERSSSEYPEDKKVKSSKHKEKNTNNKNEIPEGDLPTVSSKTNGKEGYRKSKRIENSSEGYASSHTLRKVKSSRKSSQSNDYSSEEIADNTQLENKSILKVQESKHKSENGSRNRHDSEENSLEKDNNQSAEANSSEHNSRKAKQLDDTLENLSIGYLHSEPEPKHENPSDENFSTEDISHHHSHVQSQPKSFNFSKSKSKSNAKHKPEENIVENNRSVNQDEVKKHDSTEHNTEPNEELDLISEIRELEKQTRHSMSKEAMMEKQKIPNDGNSEKSPSEKERKRKNGKHRSIKKNDHHDRARREISSALIEDRGINPWNQNYSSKDSNLEMLINNTSELLPEFRNKEMQFSADSFLDSTTTEDNNVRLESNRLKQEQEGGEYLTDGIQGHTGDHRDIFHDRSQQDSQNYKADYKLEDEHFNNYGTESEMETWKFRDDNSVEILKEPDNELLIRESNKKREVDAKQFENAVVQSINEPNLFKSFSIQENMKIGQHTGSSIIMKDDAQRTMNVHNAGNIHNAVNMNENLQMNPLGSSPSEKDFSDITYLKVSHNMPIETSDGFKKTGKILISEQNELQNLSGFSFLDADSKEKNENEEISKEKTLYSKDKSSKILQLSLELRDNQENISLKSLEAPENVDHLPVNFDAIEFMNFSHDEIKKQPEVLVTILAAEGKTEIPYSSKKISGEYDSDKDIADNESTELMYHTNLPENVKSERIPKAVMFVIENTFNNTDETELQKNEGNYMLRQETMDITKDIPKLSTIAVHNYNTSSSIENSLMRNVELLNGEGMKVYEQERSARDTNGEVSVSTGALNSITNLDDTDVPTKVSLVSLNEGDYSSKTSNANSNASTDIYPNERNYDMDAPTNQSVTLDARNSETSYANPNVSADILPNERSSSSSDAKRIKGIKPLALPKKNAERLRLEQKYKERIQKLKERRVKLKAGLFKKSDAIQTKKADNNNKINNRKRRNIIKNSFDYEVSKEHLVNDEPRLEVFEQPSGQISSSDSSDSSNIHNEKYLPQPTQLGTVRDDGETDSMDSQQYSIKFNEKAQHAALPSWNMETSVTPSYIVMESIDNVDYHASANAEQRSKEFSDLFSVPVILHKTLLVTEDYPYDSEEEAAIDEVEQDVKNNDLRSEEVFVKLTAPLINHESLKNFQQEAAYFHRLIPVHENDINIMEILYTDESSNDEVKEGLGMIRPERIVSSSLDTLPTHESDINWLIKDTSSENKNGNKKEATFASVANDLDRHSLFPPLETAGNMYHDDSFTSEERRSEEEIIFAARPRRALNINYDPFNDDLLLPFTIPLMPESQNSISSSLNAHLNNLDTEMFKEIDNNVHSVESNNKNEGTNEHKIVFINHEEHTPLKIPLNAIRVNDKSLDSSPMNKSQPSSDSADDIDPNSLDFYILGFERNEIKSDDINESESDLINYDVHDNEVKSKFLYKEMKSNDHSIPINDKENIWKYFYPKLRNHSPVKKMIKKYMHVSDLNPIIISTSAEASSALENRKNDETINNLKDSEVNLKEILNAKTNIFNNSRTKHFADHNEEVVSLPYSHLENMINYVSNKTSTHSMQQEPDNHNTESRLHSNGEDAVKAYKEPVEISAKKQPENKKIATSSQPRTLINVVKELTESVISFLHQLSPWKAFAN